MTIPTTPYACTHCGFLHSSLDEFAQVNHYGEMAVGHCGRCGFDQEIEAMPPAPEAWQTGIVCPFCNDPDAARSPSGRLYCENCGGE